MRSILNKEFILLTNVIEDNKLVVKTINVHLSLSFHINEKNDVNLFFDSLFEFLNQLNNALLISEQDKWYSTFLELEKAGLVNMLLIQEELNIVDTLIKLFGEFVDAEIEKDFTDNFNNRIQSFERVGLEVQIK